MLIVAAISYWWSSWIVGKVCQHPCRVGGWMLSNVIHDSMMHFTWKWSLWSAVLKQYINQRAAAVGVHQYKFIVDDQWRFSPDQPRFLEWNHETLDETLDETLEAQHIPTILNRLCSRGMLWRCWAWNEVLTSQSTPAEECRIAFPTCAWKLKKWGVSFQTSAFPVSCFPSCVLPGQGNMNNVLDISTYQKFQAQWAQAFCVPRYPKRSKVIQDVVYQVTKWLQANSSDQVFCFQLGALVPGWL